VGIVWQRIKPRPAEFHGRVSSDQRDRGSRNFCDLQVAGYTIRVMLDGVEQKDCDIADPIEGFVRRCKLDNRGMIYADGDEIATETISGHVQIFLDK